MKSFEKQFKSLYDQIAASDLGAVSSEKAGLSDFDLQNLRARGLINLEPAGDDSYFITIADRGYYYFDDVAARRTEIIFEWVRYAFTTLIALAALVLSIISVASKLCPR